MKCEVCKNDILTSKKYYKRRTCSKVCRYKLAKPRKVLRYKMKNGYWAIYIPEHPQAIKQGGWVYEHRVALELKIGRFLNTDESVHHIDGNRENNDVKNLKIVDSSTHTSIHWSKKTKQEKFHMMKNAWLAQKRKLGRNKWTKTIKRWELSV